LFSDTEVKEIVVFKADLNTAAPMICPALKWLVMIKLFTREALATGIDGITE